MVAHTKGIDDISVYVPKLFLKIDQLAKQRGIEVEKLRKGLGLEKMALPDVFEDTATMGANAVLSLMQKNKLKPQDIGRIYLGTESALDSAKPTASYILEMLIGWYANDFGKNCFNHCDVIDMTFACIGGVDALQNTLDWVHNQDDRIGIVVTSDFAKYELNSTGEYTQGAGAVALLIKQNPRLIEIEDHWGIATQPVHDFFKPRRRLEKSALFQEAMILGGMGDRKAADIWESLDIKSKQSFAGVDEDELTIFKETPVFDGQYSNDCYKNRILEAFDHYKEQQPNFSFKDWDFFALHLPYAFHGKRIFVEVFLRGLIEDGEMDAFLDNHNLQISSADFYSPDFLKFLYKSKDYIEFIQNKMAFSSQASSQVGNMYACSIFLSLASLFESALAKNIELSEKKIGFFAYGSGSKAKVFTGKVKSTWHQVSQEINLFEMLENRRSIDYTTYESLHREQKKEAIFPPSKTFACKGIVRERGPEEGKRSYHYVR